MIAQQHAEYTTYCFYVVFDAQLMRSQRSARPLLRQPERPLQAPADGTVMSGVLDRPIAFRRRIHMSIVSIRKRDGRDVAFDRSKIEHAIFAAFQASGSAKG
ncbi:MAG: hypothetical protein IJ343_15155, partial [Clostridia bacterium]|nr:hypothetical protein [Clostridia bacterium]